MAGLRAIHQRMWVRSFRIRVKTFCFSGAKGRRGEQKIGEGRVETGFTKHHGTESKDRIRGAGKIGSIGGKDFKREVSTLGKNSTKGFFSVEIET